MKKKYNRILGGETINKQLATGTERFSSPSTPLSKMSIRKRNPLRFSLQVENDLATATMLDITYLHG
jgi:hypothetical protein